MKDPFQTPTKTQRQANNNKSTHNVGLLCNLWIGMVGQHVTVPLCVVHEKACHYVLGTVLPPNPGLCIKLGVWRVQTGARVQQLVCCVVPYSSCHEQTKHAYPFIMPRTNKTSLPLHHATPRTNKTNCCQPQIGDLLAWSDQV